MKYTTIHIEGSILSADILDKIERGDLGGQTPKDFCFEASIKVKDEMARAWADAQELWRVFKSRMERVKEGESGATETRRYWMLPFLGFLGYDVEYQQRPEVINEKIYFISHRAVNRDGFPIHIMGFRDSLDRRRIDSGPRMSPHALVQEFINLHEHLYAIVTNGLQLRLLRDAGKLVKLSYMEFDLEQMFEEDHFADFAILFRLLHISRMPSRQDAGAESIIEKYHQDTLDSGARIREGLSEAVENSIKSLANGFLNHPDNDSLREILEDNRLIAKDIYQYQLRMIYRILFLMVIEERNLVFPENVDNSKKKIYYDFYSIARIRKISELRCLQDLKHCDYWISIKNTFKLFESDLYGKALGLKPLAGDLFNENAIGILNECSIDNKILLACIKNLNFFTNKDTGQLMRVNYAALNVEEFGSVYEGLLDYDPEISKVHGKWEFYFVKGEGRSASGTHYTPDELVQPLIKHSLEYIIEDHLKEKNTEDALLSIKVCDVACGSGHILLNAARRIATALARARTGEDQPSPTAFRSAIRDVIRNCIYGVDINPLAVELCKVAMWLEAHNPGEPLNFLDHHIKCGDAIVGLAHKEEFENGIADEAFKSFTNDSPEIKKICSDLKKKNKKERDEHKSELTKLEFPENLTKSVLNIAAIIEEFNKIPENTPEQIIEKQNKYKKIVSGPHWWNLKALADMQVAQFFMPKDRAHNKHIVTDGEYREYLTGKKALQGQIVAESMAIASDRKVFHWFLEFPEVFAKGGFDCILGNPPYLGGKKISGTFGTDYWSYLTTTFSPSGGQADLVVYFLRRIHGIIKENSFFSILTTNTISQGDSREFGLDIIIEKGEDIIYAVKSTKWPGLATVEVSIFSLFKGEWKKTKYLDNLIVNNINSSLLADYKEKRPCVLKHNDNIIFKGSFFLGDSFILTNEFRAHLLKNKSNNEIIFPYITGKDLNENFDQNTSKYVINFFDWDEETAKKYKDAYEYIKERAYPLAQKLPETNSTNIKRKKYWWQYADRTPSLYNKLRDIEFCFGVCIVGKYINFKKLPNNYVYANSLGIVAEDSYEYFSLLQNTFHAEWARKYGSSLRLDLRYTITDIFLTYPFPFNYSSEIRLLLKDIGEKYNDFRDSIMLKIQLGLTKTFNQFHNNKVTIENSNRIVSISKNIESVEMEFNKETANLIKHLDNNEKTISIEVAIEIIVKLRELHVQMDNAVLEAYGWQDVPLKHDFYEVDYLPENDRVRFTIHPDARKEILKRLLLLNHEIHEMEMKKGAGEVKMKVKSKKKQDEETEKMF